ncbi:MAG: hypothetical protein H7Y28_07460 [Rhodoferax sp.]|nr:hypothetical protein [Rhodoferax sp.]
MRTLVNAIVLVAGLAMSTGAAAQSVYKCGNNYSQIPCADAVKLSTEDARTAAQKKDSEKAVARDMQAAKTMEKERLVEEKKAQASGKESAKVIEKISAAQAPATTKPAKDEVRKGDAPKKKSTKKVADKTK